MSIQQIYTFVVSTKYEWQPGTAAVELLNGNCYYLFLYDINNIIQTYCIVYKQATPKRYILV